MVARDPHAIAGLGRQQADRFSAGRENLGDGMRLTVGADDLRGLAYEVVDPLPAVCGRDQRVAGHARIGGVDAAVLRAGVPFVDGRVVLRSGIGADPCSPSDLVPELARLDLLDHFAVHPPGERPFAVFFKRLEKAVGDTDTVVGILTRNGLIRLAVPVRIVFVEGKMRETFFGVGEHTLNIRFGHGRLPRLPNRFSQFRIGRKLGIHF